MPFTLAHPAVAVPLARYGLPLSALVVGSMAPDFPYFLFLSIQNQYGHSLAGVFLFCLPVGLAVLLLFHALLKRPLLSLLPESHQAKLRPVAGRFPLTSVDPFLRMVLALLLGAFSHLLWDAFTHANSGVVQHTAFLRFPLVQTAHGSVPVFKALQHLSSVVGVVLLLVWYRRWFAHAPAVPMPESVVFSRRERVRIIAAMAAGAVLMAALYGGLSMRGFSGSRRLPPFARGFAVAGVGALLTELIIFSGLYQIRFRTGREAGSATQIEVRERASSPSNRVQQ